MKIKIVSAIGGDTLELDVNENINIQSLKEKITEIKKIPIHIYVLAYRGTEITDTSSSLKDLGIIENEKIYLIMRTEGG
ncbi:MAG: ubiquitin-like domain-containing protein [Candidatus Helarchaeota archaeon]